MCCERLHRQTDHIGDAAFDYMHIRIVFFLNSIGARAALPDARGEISVDLGFG